MALAVSGRQEREDQAYGSQESATIEHPLTWGTDTVRRCFSNCPELDWSLHLLNQEEKGGKIRMSFGAERGRSGKTAKNNIFERSTVVVLVLSRRVFKRSLNSTGSFRMGGETEINIKQLLGSP